MKSGRPSGFPRGAWALIDDGDDDLRRIARRAWVTARRRNEMLGWRIIGEIVGVDPQAAAAAHQNQKAERRAEEEASAPVIVNCDGLCQPRNPGGTATFGWIARRNHTVLGQDCGVVAQGPRATNNLAEYTAIIEALRWLRTNGLVGERVILRSDSQLAINQLDGTFAVRSPKIYPLWAAATQAAKPFANLSFQWVPRKQNTEADALTRVAYENSRSSKQEGATDQSRAERARALVEQVSAVGDDRWRVPSSSGRGHYTVALRERPSCTCPDFGRRRAVCKHILAVQMASA